MDLIIAGGEPAVAFASSKIDEIKENVPVQNRIDAVKSNFSFDSFSGIIESIGRLN